MRRIALIVLGIPALAGGLAAAAGADDTRTYKIEMYNAFGIVEQADMRVSGVNVGQVTDLDVNEDKRAVVTVKVSGDLARLGDETKCESSPQSLLGEYFIDCVPDGEELPDGGTIPAANVEQTVQPDLVQNTMREPFRLRLQLILNEFGTAIAGSGETLNEAIRLGAPALTELEEVTSILASQNVLIRDLNANSERVSGELARVKNEIVRFVDEGEDVARTAVERRADVSRGFDLFDDYIAELGPTLTQLGQTARQQTPLLTDLHAAAPDLVRLSENLPRFQRASETSLETLGEAAVVGERALRRGRDEIELLAEAGKEAPVAAEILADFFRDIDDPRRATEINDLAEATTGRTGEEPGTRNTKGYTGLEGLLNYAYYQALALNQFDSNGHALQISLHEVFSGPCGAFTSGRNTSTGEPGVPTDGGTTTSFSEIPRCSTWLGPNQPGINEDLGLPKYHPSVCPTGTDPDHARVELCDPNDPVKTRARSRARGGGRAGGGGDASAPPAAGEAPGGGPALPVDPGEIRDELEDLLDLPKNALDGLGLGGKKGKGKKGKGGLGSLSQGTTKEAEDLLDFLFKP